ncbi:hypothetical protein J3F84DRAFT_382349 [Trichoderma pleuroticola]
MGRDMVQGRERKKCNQGTLGHGRTSRVLSAAHSCKVRAQRQIPSALFHLPSVGNFDYQIRCLISSYPEASVDLLDESPSRGKEPAGWEPSPLQSCLLLAQQMEWRAAGGLVRCQGSSYNALRVSCLEGI